MNYNPDIHHRHSIRLKEYDYSQTGIYFVTLCSQNRENIFGEIVDYEMVLNQFGEIVQNEWLRSSDLRHEITLDYYQVMPNHFHGIVIINKRENYAGYDAGAEGVGVNCVWTIGGANGVGANGRSPLQSPGQLSQWGMRPKSLSSLIAGFKSSVTSKINQLRATPHLPVWQRNFYEHIIRDEVDLNKIRDYIANNPLNWNKDRDNLENITS